MVTVTDNSLPSLYTAASQPKRPRTPVAIAVLAVLLLAPLIAGAQEIRDLGDVVLEFPTMEVHSRERPIRAALMGRQASGSSFDPNRCETDLCEIVRDVNREISLRENIRLTFLSAPQEVPPAQYDVKTNQILITYGFVTGLRDDLVVGDYDSWFPNVVQIVLHEIGHALIDVNKLGSPGQEQEEIMADQLAFFIISEFYEDEAEEGLERVAEHFMSRARPGNSLNANTVHLPGDQRAKDILCWLHGDIETHTGKPAPGQPGACARAYRQLVDAWDIRLVPMWKDPFPSE